MSTNRGSAAVIDINARRGVGTAISSSSGAQVREIAEHPTGTGRVEELYPDAGDTTQLIKLVRDCKEAFEDALDDDPLVMDDLAVTASKRLVQLVLHDRGMIGMVAGTLFAALSKHRLELLPREQVETVVWALGRLQERPYMTEREGTELLLKLRAKGLSGA